MAAHSSILAWRIPWTEEPGMLHPMGLCRIGHDCMTITFIFMHNTLSLEYEEFGITVRYIQQANG